MTEAFITDVDWLIYFAGALILFIAVRRVDRKFAVPPPPPMPRKLPSRDVFELGYEEWAGRRITNVARAWPIYLFFVLFLLFKHLASPRLLSSVYLFGASACAVASLGAYTTYRWLRSRTGSDWQKDRRSST